MAAGTPATVALSRARVPHTVHPYEHDADNTHFGEEAAAALGLDPHRVFKTLMVQVQAQRPELVVAVVPVAGQLDLKALASAVNAKKATMADPSQAEKATGYIVGGISPLGQKKTHRTVIDATAKQFDTIMVSAGRRGLQVELAPDDLARLCRADYASIGR